MKLSICMISYNHESYIAEAIEGVLMQQVNFDYELVIGEDCSSDNTRNVVKAYKEKYPEKIKALLPKKNLGMMPNFLATLKACTGEYIALCEGDDYWIDPHKLQKQVDFLDQNKDFMACCTNVQRLVDATGEFVLDERLNQTSEEEYDFEKLLERDGYIYTPTFVFRNIFKEYPAWFNHVQAGDKSLFYLCALTGKIKYFPVITTIYRYNLASISHVNNKNKIRQWENYLFLLDSVDAYSHYKYKDLIAKRKQPYRNILRILKEDSKLRKIFYAGKYFLLYGRKNLNGVKESYWLATT